MARKTKGKRGEPDDLPQDTGVISNFGDDEEFDDETRYKVVDADERALALAFGSDAEFEVKVMRLTSEIRDGRSVVAPVIIRFRQLSMTEVIGLQRGEKIDTSNRINPKITQRRAYQILKAGILSHEIVNCPRGEANYAAGEISIEDLNPGEVNLLWEMVAPGMQKSREDISKRALSILRVAREDVSSTSESDCESV